MKTIHLEITMTEDNLFLSRLGYPGTQFDTGEDGTEMKEAIDDLAKEILDIYNYEKKKG